MSLDLTDRAAVNEAVAKAMAWQRCRDHGLANPECWRRECSNGRAQMHIDAEPPDYLSDDPALNDEMWKALPRESNTWWRISEGPVSTGERWYWVQRGWDTGDIDECGTTLAEALVRALYAAGLLDKETRDE